MNPFRECSKLRFLAGGKHQPSCPTVHRVDGAAEGVGVGLKMPGTLLPRGLHVAVRPMPVPAPPERNATFSGSVLVAQSRVRGQRTFSARRIRRTWPRPTWMPASRGARARASRVHCAGRPGR
jgi:hypothetical protein